MGLCDLLSESLPPRIHPALGMRPGQNTQAISMVMRVVQHGRQASHVLAGQKRCPPRGVWGVQRQATIWGSGSNGTKTAVGGSVLVAPMRPILRAKISQSLIKKNTLR
ncbi:MAG: hypothetical protein C7B46_13770 [Sulfobacillus benefaciens]|uniref:Uncharacterized protein n=1 Tax=Sulfobacillus benefaciens TaxID=453960 RepID=A0A2T2XDI5_9FIRM|nr:MAG: hypothetical protein C7B46_13770 [Sulfobacillus benefaciens]